MPTPGEEERAEALRLSLVHLSGPRRGETDVLSHLPAGIGSDPGADVIVPGVAPRHASLLQRASDVILQDAGSGAGTWLDGAPIQEALLHDGDVVELGTGGPKLRFRTGLDSASLVQAMVWARPEGAPDRLADTTSFLATLGHELSLRTTRSFRYTVAALSLLGVASVGWSVYESIRLNREIRSLRRDVRAAEDQRRDFERRIQEERHRARAERAAFERQTADFRKREAELNTRLADAAAGEVQSLRAELTATRERLTAIETERVAAEEIIRRYGAGVCLVQGAYAFYDKTGRPLRYKASDDAPGEHSRSSDGSLELEVNGTGEIHTVEFYGTGFLVDKRGTILTNRHVGEPWWKDATSTSLEKQGFHAQLLLFRAFFPKEQKPFDLQFERHAEVADLALLKVNLRGRKIPVLPLAQDGTAAVAGQPVVLVGYPTGLEALLAKTDSALVGEIVAAHGTDSQRVTETLGQKGLIRPSTTQGHIGDVTKSDIVFDAPTTAGGSGGPLFNKAGVVVAVEYAVLEKFGGNSFGVPIHYALELLRPPPKSPGR